MTEKKPPAQNNGRMHIRSKMRAQLKITNSSVGEILVHTYDLSDGGLFALAEGQELPKIGEIIQVQVQGLPIEAPILTAEVMHTSSKGMGLMFK